MYIDIFAGCGGLSYGFFKAEIKGTFAIEKNKDAFSTLKYNLIDKHNHYNWPEWLPVENHDINELMEKYRNHLLSLRGKIKVVVGGPPCQGFSSAGARNKDDLRNTLSKSYLEFIHIVQPEIVLFENVSGFTIGFNNCDGREESYSSILIRKLNAMGYSVDTKIIDMSQFGVPQKRKRFILVGSKSSSAMTFFDILEKNRYKILEKKNLKVPISIDKAIDDLQQKYGCVESNDSKGYLNGKYGRKSSAYIKLMREGINNSIPDSHRFVKHRPETIQRFTELMDISSEPIRFTPSNNHGVKLKKRSVMVLKRKYTCNTLTSIPDDMIHYSEPRVMTVREYARIQSFPDTFLFKGKYTTGGVNRRIEVPRYTQIANAVPPLFAEHVGVALKELLKIDNERRGNN